MSVFITIMLVFFILVQSVLIVLIGITNSLVTGMVYYVIFIVFNAVPVVFSSFYVVKMHRISMKMMDKSGALFLREKNILLGLMNIVQILQIFSYIVLLAEFVIIFLRLQGQTERQANYILSAIGSNITGYYVLLVITTIWELLILVLAFFFLRRKAMRGPHSMNATTSTPRHLRTKSGSLNYNDDDDSDQDTAKTTTATRTRTIATSTRKLIDDDDNNSNNSNSNSSDDNNSEMSSNRKNSSDTRKNNNNSDNSSHDSSTDSSNSSNNHNNSDHSDDGVSSSIV